MANQFGVTPQGFAIARQADCKAGLEADLRAALGDSIELDGASLLGQIVAIQSEREALLWELSESICLSFTPAGASGVFVDNLGALIGQVRKAAVATTTNPTPSVSASGITSYGLRLFGTPGTVVPQGSLLQTTAAVPTTFRLDADVTIAQASNAAQRVILSGVPTTGAYQLVVTTPLGNAITTPAISYQALAAQSQILFSQAPSAGQLRLGIDGQPTSALPFNATAAQVQAAIVALTGYQAATVTGSMASGFFVSWPTGKQPRLSTSVTTLSYAQAPQSGAFVLRVAGSLTASLAFNASAADVQAALRALNGYAAVSVTGSAASGYVIVWPGAYPAFAVDSQTTDQSLTAARATTLDVTPNSVDSIQATLNNLIDTTTGLLPLTDVVVSQLGAQALTLSFGANTPTSQNPSSGASAWPLVSVTNNTLRALVSGTTATFNQVNVAVSNVTFGSPAQGIGSATATQTGAIQVLAKQLSVLGTTMSGLTGCVNDLDCLSGQTTESDAEALARWNASRAVRGNGTLASILTQVGAVSGVTACIAFVNNTAASLQRLTFAQAPTSGTYALTAGGVATAPLAFNTTAAQLQVAIAQLPAWSAVQVSGSASGGFSIDPNGSNGGQPMRLLTLASDTTGQTPQVTYSRPASSVETVVQGGSDADVAAALYSAAPAGIALYGAPTLITMGSATAGSSVVQLASTAGASVGQTLSMQGLGAGTGVIASVSGTSVTLTAAALSTTSNVAASVATSVPVIDSSGVIHQVGFTRPQQLTFYVRLSILTDLFKTPGDANSGVNPNAQFNPATLPAIEQAIVDTGNAFDIGQTIVASGSNGLVGAFNQFAGITAYTLQFDTANPPVNMGNVSLASNQVPLFSTSTTTVSYT